MLPIGEAIQLLTSPRVHLSSGLFRRAEDECNCSGVAAVPRAPSASVSVLGQALIALDNAMRAEAQASNDEQRVPPGSISAVARILCPRIIAPLVATTRTPASGSTKTSSFSRGERRCLRIWAWIWRHPVSSCRAELRARLEQRPLERAADEAYATAAVEAGAAERDTLQAAGLLPLLCLGAQGILLHLLRSPSAVGHVTASGCGTGCAGPAWLPPPPAAIVCVAFARPLLHVVYAGFGEHSTGIAKRTLLSSGAAECLLTLVLRLSLLVLCASSPAVHVGAGGDEHASCQHQRAPVAALTAAAALRVLWPAFDSVLRVLCSWHTGKPGRATLAIATEELRCWLSLLFSRAVKEEAQDAATRTGAPPEAGTIGRSMHDAVWYVSRLVPLLLPQPCALVSRKGGDGMGVEGEPDDAMKLTLLKGTDRQQHIRLWLERARGAQRRREHLRAPLCQRNQSDTIAERQQVATSERLSLLAVALLAGDSAIQHSLLLGSTASPEKARAGRGRAMPSVPCGSSCEGAPIIGMLCTTAAVALGNECRSALPGSLLIHALTVAFGAGTDDPTVDADVAAALGSVLVGNCGLCTPLEHGVTAQAPESIVDAWLLSLLEQLGTSAAGEVGDTLVKLLGRRATRYPSRVIPPLLRRLAGCSSNFTGGTSAGVAGHETLSTPVLSPCALGPGAAMGSLCSIRVVLHWLGDLAAGEHAQSSSAAPALPFDLPLAFQRAVLCALGTVASPLHRECSLTQQRVAAIRASAAQAIAAATSVRTVVYRNVASAEQDRGEYLAVRRIRLVDRVKVIPQLLGWFWPAHAAPEGEIAARDGQDVQALCGTALESLQAGRLGAERCILQLLCPIDAQECDTANAVSEATSAVLDCVRMRQIVLPHLCWRNADNATGEPADDELQRLMWFDSLCSSAIQASMWSSWEQRTLALLPRAAQVAAHIGTPRHAQARSLAPLLRAVITKARAAPSDATLVRALRTLAPHLGSSSGFAAVWPFLLAALEDDPKGTAGATEASRTATTPAYYGETGWMGAPPLTMALLKADGEGARATVQALLFARLAVLLPMRVIPTDAFVRANQRCLKPLLASAMRPLVLRLLRGVEFEEVRRLAAEVAGRMPPVLFVPHAMIALGNVLHEAGIAYEALARSGDGAVSGVSMATAAAAAAAAAQEVLSSVPKAVLDQRTAMAAEMAERESGSSGHGGEEPLRAAVRTATAFVYGLCHAIMAHCAVQKSGERDSGSAHGGGTGAEQWAKQWPSVRRALLAITDLASTSSGPFQRLGQLKHGAVECITLVVQAALSADKDATAREDARALALSLSDKSVSTPQAVARQLLLMVPDRVCQTNPVADDAMALQRVILAALVCCGGADYGWPSCETLVRRKGLRRTLQSYMDAESMQASVIADSRCEHCPPSSERWRVMAVGVILRFATARPQLFCCRESGRNAAQTQLCLTAQAAAAAAAAAAIEAAAFAHAAATAATVTSPEPAAVPALCGTWALTRSCPCNRCPFAHSFSDATGCKGSAAQLRERADAMRARRGGHYARQEAMVVAAAGVSAVDPWPLIFSADYPPGATAASVFASWLVAKFGARRLSAGAGVIDVAGGNGCLARELNARGVLCTVVDPLCGTSTRWREATLKTGAGDAYPHMREIFDARFAVRHAALLREASLVTGLHPDEATNAIIEVSLAANLPFALVPCCVFSSSYLRQLSDGSRVQDSTELLVWLLEQSSDCRCAQLPFHGMNKGVLPPDTVRRARPHLAPTRPHQSPSRCFTQWFITWVW